MEDTNISKTNIGIIVVDFIAGVISYVAVFAAISVVVVAMFISAYTMLFAEPTVYEATVINKQEKIVMSRTGGYTTPTIYVSVDECILDTAVSDSIYACIEVNDTVEVEVWDVFGKHQIMRLHNTDSIFDKEVSIE